MLGYWNKSVYVTYLGLFSAIVGYLLFLQTNNVDYAYIGMIIAAVCDMFDGKVARSIKNRTDKEKEFGVEIDSLADIVCFIVLPGLTIYGMGCHEIYHIILIALYGVCGVVRLAYFNVAMSNKDSAIKVYQGLPVPVSILIFGLVWLLGKAFGSVRDNWVIIYTILLPLVGFLHISKIKIKKFTGTWFYILVTLVSIVAILLGIFAF